MANEGKFLCFASYYGNFYAIELESFQNCLKSGKICFGAGPIQFVQYCKTRLEKMNIDVNYIGLLPKSIELAKSRMVARGQISKARMDVRMKNLEEQWKLMMENKDWIKPII
jgi:guanylate kinase